MKQGMLFLGLAILACLLLALAGCFLIPTTPDDYSDITETEAQEILDVFGFATSMLDRLGDNPEPSELDAVVDWFTEQAIVRAAYASDEDTVWVEFDCGLLGSVSAHSLECTEDINFQRSQTSHVIPTSHWAIDVGVSANSASSAQRRAVILSPYPELGGTSENVAIFRQKLNGMGIADTSVDVYTGAQASLEVAQELDVYEIIYIITHGRTSEKRQWLVLGEDPTAKKFSQFWNQCRGIIGLSGEEGSYHYMISDKFFAAKKMAFPESIIFLNACTSMKKNLLSSALIDCGAGLVLGWTNLTNGNFVKIAMNGLLSAASLPHVTMADAYKKYPFGVNHLEFESVDTAFPISIMVDQDQDDEILYQFEDGQYLFDLDDVSASVNYSSDLVLNGNTDVVLSELSWSESSNKLYAIDVRSNGSDICVGVIQYSNGVTVNITDIAYSHSDGVLFGVSYSQLVTISTEGCSLSEESARRATLIGDGLHVLYETSALACDSSGNLYAGTVGGDLLSINQTTGRASTIGTYGSGYLASGDLAFDESDTLYGSAMRDGETDDVLVEISTATGSATQIGSIGYDKVFGLFFMGDDLYGVTADSELISINTCTGHGAFVRNLGFSAWGAQDLGE